MRTIEENEKIEKLQSQVSLMQETSNSLNRSIFNVSKEIEALKNSPKQPEIKTGDWVYITGEGHTRNNDFFPKGELFLVDSVEKPYVRNRMVTSAVTGQTTDLECVRLATPSEVEQHLISEAKKRYKVGDKIKRSHLWDDCSNDDVKIEGGWTENYEAYNDRVSLGGVYVYNKGKWATIIEVKDQPILIGGYEITFHSTYITVNACQYTKTDLQQIYHVLKMEQVRSLNVGCTGQIKVTLDEINLILERLK